MSAIERLLQRPLVIHRPVRGVRDSHGRQAVVSWADTPVVGYLEQRQTEEVVIGQDTYSATWFGAFPAGTALSAWDRVEDPAAGLLFEVLGSPARPRRAINDEEHHVEAKLREVTAYEPAIPA